HPGLNRAADYVRDQWAAAGIRVEEQPYTADGRPVRNVIARFGPPSSPECIVVGAHCDAHGGMPGADDNASGVAGLIELGRLLAEKPPARGVELAAFALEEAPYFFSPQMGSWVHVESLRRRSSRVSAMLCRR